MKKCAKTGVRTWDSYLLGKNVFFVQFRLFNYFETVQIFLHRFRSISIVLVFNGTIMTMTCTFYIFRR